MLSTVGRLCLHLRQIMNDGEKLGWDEINLQRAWTQLLRLTSYIETAFDKSILSKPIDDLEFHGALDAKTAEHLKAWFQSGRRLEKEALTEGGKPAALITDFARDLMFLSRALCDFHGADEPIHEAEKWLGFHSIQPICDRKAFKLQGRKITFQQDGVTNFVRILVNGAPIKMIFLEQESTATNSGNHTKPLKPAIEVEWAPLRSCIASSARFTLMEKTALPRAFCSWGSNTAEMFNSTIYSYEGVDLKFAPDFSTVEVVLTHSTDLTT